MAVVKTLIGNIKGPKGDTGAKGDKGDKGDIGATGQRGSRWIQGTAITGTSTTDTVFSESGISDALVNDNYLNTSTGNTYRCTVAGDASTAKWVYSGNIKGVKGDTGAKGDKGDTGATGPQGPQGEYAAVDSALSKTSTNPIQNKAVAEEFEKKLNSDGDSKDLTTTFTSNDSTNVTEWTDVGLMTSGEKHSSLFQKIATMFKNIRYLYHMLGTADISTLGEGADIGTVTGALSKLNSDYISTINSIAKPVQNVANETVRIYLGPFMGILFAHHNGQPFFQVWLIDLKSINQSNFAYKLYSRSPNTTVWEDNFTVSAGYDTDKGSAYIDIISTMTLGVSCMLYGGVGNLTIPTL